MLIFECLINILLLLEKSISQAFLSAYGLAVFHNKFVKD